MTTESLAERNIDLLAGIENLINGTLRELFVKTRLVSMALKQIEGEATIEDVSLLMGEVESLSPVVGHVRSCLSEFHETAWDVNRQAMGLR
jgi:hypothetical protein